MVPCVPELQVGGYYDDELVELNSSYDQVLEECQALRRRYTLRPPRWGMWLGLASLHPRPTTEEVSNTVEDPCPCGLAALGRVT